MVASSHRNTEEESPKRLTVASFFSGCGGLDLGFKKAGFEVVWANEYDKSIWKTYEANHQAPLDRRSIVDISPSDIPNVDGFIGGPPCQSWSLAGSMRGDDDPRGKVFKEYIRLLASKRPVFFVAENVPGLVSSKHSKAFIRLAVLFREAGYEISTMDLVASDYGVPQDRQRVIIVGFRTDINGADLLTKMQLETVTSGCLRDAIGGMPPPPPALSHNMANPPDTLSLPNHEYATGGFSSHYMSRNRIRRWDEKSFTIVASARHCPLHPDSGSMIHVFEYGDDNLFEERHYFKVPDRFDFADGSNPRRLSVRECSRIQTFPDDFVFYYKSVVDGYKMVGNAVPVRLAQAVGEGVLRCLKYSKRTE